MIVFKIQFFESNLLRWQSCNNFTIPIRYGKLNTFVIICLLFCSVFLARVMGDIVHFLNNIIHGWQNSVSYVKKPSTHM